MGEPMEIEEIELKISALDEEEITPQELEEISRLVEETLREGIPWDQAKREIGL